MGSPLAENSWKYQHRNREIRNTKAEIPKQKYHVRMSTKIQKPKAETIFMVIGSPLAHNSWKYQIRNRKQKNTKQKYHVRMATKIQKTTSRNKIDGYMLTIGTEQLEIPEQKQRKWKYQIGDTKARMSQQKYKGNMKAGLQR